MNLRELYRLERGTELRLKGTDVIFELLDIDHSDKDRPAYIKVIEEDARNVKEFNHTITASELVLSKSVFQVELRKTLESATPAKAESAKHRPSIQELRKLSEEYNPENLLDEAYQILEEQARLGERRANLTGKFKNCIQHFKREGFNVLEHGMLIEISW